MPGELWVDFKELKDRISIEAVLEHYGLLGKLQRKGKQLVGLCPIHHTGAGDGKSNKQQFSVNVEKNSFKCWAASCGKHGDQIALVAALEGCDTRTAALLMQGWPGTTPRPEAPAAKAKPEPEDRDGDAHLDARDAPATAEATENQPLSWFYTTPLDTAHPYLVARLKRETIAEFGQVKAYRKGELVEASGQLGFCTKKGFHHGRITIPIADENGVLLAYAGRWAGPEDEVPKGEGKYKLPLAKDFKPSLALFNLHRAIANAGPKRIVVIGEGYFQAMKIAEHGYRCSVGLMGSSISDRQVALIAKDFQAALVFLDAGAEAAAEKVAGKLAGAGVWTKLVRCPAGKQPDDLSAEELRTLLG